MVALLVNRAQPISTTGPGSRLDLHQHKATRSIGLLMRTRDLDDGVYADVLAGHLVPHQPCAGRKQVRVCNGGALVSVCLSFTGHLGQCLAARHVRIAASSSAPTSPSTLSSARSSARVRPRLTMAIGRPSSCASRT